ncbi:HAD family hydrolase [Arenimonas sp. MALMAid1274]|uniref:HAD family hydrolase n=1 Tax=Arenimonas sp. MALMAid1274 TaxID=3411630 RepID=UPI003BA3D48F
MDLALFDFDGTLTDRETMPVFMHRAVRPRRLAWGKPLLMPLVVGYRIGAVPGTVVRAAICRLGFRGVPAAELEGHGQAFAQDYLPTVLRPEMMARIGWHRDRGDTVALVSGGLDVYLAPWARQHGLALLCSQLERDGDRLTGRYQGHQCVGAEKARRVRQQYDLARFGRIYAYGDTPEDRELLALAHEACYRGLDGRAEP